MTLKPVVEAKGETEEEETSTPHPPDTVTADIPIELFSFYGIPDLLSPVKITLQGTEVDLSHAIQAIKRVKKTDYESRREITKAFDEVYLKAKHLCETLKTNSDICIDNAGNKLLEIDDIKEFINIPSQEAYFNEGF